MNAPSLHYYPFAWEAAVVEFTGDGPFGFSLTYETPLSGDVEVFATDEETDEFIKKAADYFRAQEVMK